MSSFSTCQVLGVEADGAQSRAIRDEHDRDGSGALDLVEFARLLKQAAYSSYSSSSYPSSYSSYSSSRYPSSYSSYSSSSYSEHTSTNLLSSH